VNQSARRIPIFAFLATLAMALLAMPASATVLPERSKEAASEGSNIVPGHYIVVLEDSVKGPAAVAEAQTEQRDGELGFVYRHALKGYSAELSQGAVKALRRDPRVKRVDPVRRFEIASQTTPTGIERIFATANEALDIDEEDDVRVDVDVAVIDTGIDTEHPDLDVAGRTNCVPPGKLSEPEASECVDDTGTDDHDHGTHVAGTIGALDNEEGVVGVAPGARLWAVKVLTPYIFGSAVGETPWIVAGIDWVTATREDEDPENDIEVANMSLGGKGPNPAFDEAIEGSVEAGIVYVVAAGNSTSNAKFFSPASSPDVITVSALADYDGEPGGEAEPSCTNWGPDDTLADFSNWGKEVELAAPGACILSTLPGDEYGTSSGTSMASPHVAGAAAILASESKPQSAEDVEAVRRQLLDEASLDWSDNSGDFYREPLLYLDDEAAPVEAVTEMATKIGIEGATLNGSIEARGEEVAYSFEYGTTASYGFSTFPQELPGGSSYAKVSKTISGLSPGTSYHYRVIVKGPEWTLEGEDQTFTPTPWSAQIPPVGPRDSLNGISCVSASECIAVGSEAVEYELEKEEFGFKFGLYYAPLAMRWANGKWEQLAAQSPGEKMHIFKDVSCTSVTFCMAIGGGPTSIGSDSIPWTQRWDGAQWTVSPIEIPADAKENSLGMRLSLSSISCASASSCIAVGGYPIGYTKTGGSINQALIEAWDGKEWQVIAPPSEAPASLASVSCPAADSCVAVGGTKSLILEMSEGKWSAQPVSTSTNLYDVSCNKVNSCLAVGGKVARRWNGKLWSSLPAPGKAMTDISCISPNWCLAVEPVEGDVERWDAFSGEWVPQQLAVRLDESGEEIEHGIPVDPASGVSAVSCLPAACMAIGESPQRLSITTAKTKDATSITSSKATLNGIVNPHGSETSYQFEYGTTTSYGSKAPASFKLVGSGTKDVKVSQSISGLKPGTTYHFRVMAIKSPDLGPVYGEDLTFTVPAPPTATTEAATEVTDKGTILNATVNPNGLATTYRFEYGTTTAYGSSAPIPDEAIGSGTSEVKVAEPLEGLTPNTTYHYRVVATNAEGTVKGEDQTFTTKVDPRFQFAFGKPGSESGQFEEAMGIEIDSAGNTWVVDANLGRVQKFNAKGEYLSQLGWGALGYPIDLEIDSAGNLWVTDAEYNLVKKFSPTGGKYLAQFGTEGSGNGQLLAPSGIEIDSAGNLWVADSSNHRVQKFSPEGKYLAQFGSKGTGNGQLNEPYGLAIDSSDNVWVADSNNNRVQKFNAKGEYLLQSGEGGIGPGQFNVPMGVEADSAGNVWVVDAGNHRVQKLSPEGEYLNQFGTVGSGAGQLDYPTYIAIDPEGDLWVTDSYPNNRVQVWSP
jgi:subtilisin family serine protease/streptogramin lyase